jgi:hypothetical protein
MNVYNDGAQRTPALDPHQRYGRASGPPAGASAALPVVALAASLTMLATNRRPRRCSALHRPLYTPLRDAALCTPWL